MTVAVWLGASTFEGAGATGATMAATCSARLGWTPVIAAVGGTGFLAAPVAETYRNRLPIVFASNPDVVVIQGTVNDSAYTDAQIGAEAALVFGAIAAWKPSTLIYMTGMLPRRSYEAATRSGWTAAIRSALGSYGVFVDPLTGGWLTGTGTVGAPMGDGNADIYLSVDTFHPTQAGHDYLGTRLAFAISPPATGLI